MRISEAALALITRVNTQGETEYLTQWNEKWQAYSLIGRHREERESFRECCIREVAEELECDEYTITAAPYPYATLRFREFSRAAKAETDYHWQVFLVCVADSTLQRLPSDWTWVGADRIRARFAITCKPIAEQVHRVLQAVENAEFDLFVSYGHADNQDGSVTALIEHIRQQHEQFSPNDPLKIFFDLWKIRDGDDWQRRIYRRWYHASEYVWSCAKDLHADPARAAAFAKASLSHLHERGGKGLLAELLSICQSPDAPLPSPVQSLVNYIQPRQARMNYPRFIAQGWPIGTGMMESTGKQLVARRLKGCGMHWSPDGATAVTALRAEDLSGHWYQLWAHLTLTG